ncbi:hypothetical protein L4D76_00415 [Photobacterium sagamiensis]|uniref:hypothetical protein n=1 Tax=Photobacterium sagamiensis TaxID=2910241 RepID=UPI003D0BCA20
MYDEESYCCHYYLVDGLVSYLKFKKFEVTQLYEAQSSLIHNLTEHSVNLTRKADRFHTEGYISPGHCHYEIANEIAAQLLDEHLIQFEELPDLVTWDEYLNKIFLDWCEAPSPTS